MIDGDGGSNTRSPCQVEFQDVSGPVFILKTTLFLQKGEDQSKNRKKEGKETTERTREEEGRQSLPFVFSRLMGERSPAHRTLYVCSLSGDDTCDNTPTSLGLAFFLIL